MPENEPSQELDPIGPHLTDGAPSASEAAIQPGKAAVEAGGRRRKAALVLMIVWSVTLGLHWVAWGAWLIWGATAALAAYLVRLVLALPPASAPPLPHDASAPFVSILVAARNEAAAIGGTLEQLCDLDYPAHRYEVWAIDDGSTDGTGALLDAMADERAQLQVLHRPIGAQGGKSGALNQALGRARGEIVAVFDADARVSPELLRWVVPQFEAPQTGAVQVRKAIVNATCNGWTRAQAAEMALDSYFQQQRTAASGIGELRGNGQFVKRRALAQCGGWNESTLTDDLDLSLQLHLNRWNVRFLNDPAVTEEGVTALRSLWHQRNRWAEGGYQRFLDYWQSLVRSPQLGATKRLDLLAFLVVQYLLPMAAVPDLLAALLQQRQPLLAPLTLLLVGVSVWATAAGLRRSQPAGAKPTPLADWATILWGNAYMLHWVPVMAAVTARMAVQPKRLNWIKMPHQGPAQNGTSESVACSESEGG
ncbi:MAG: glycosyl transferase [Cyanobacteria bacterium QS_8_64_29]|nr:MAG: glycosyl transferase [Cyanobacteria bacterium QS_8_64_29]